MLDRIGKDEAGGPETGRGGSAVWASWQALLEHDGASSVARGRESTYQCRGHRLDPWSGKIPHAKQHRTPQLLKAEGPRACAPQEEKQAQWTTTKRVNLNHCNESSVSQSQELSSSEPHTPSESWKAPGLQFPAPHQVTSDIPWAGGGGYPALTGPATATQH